MQTKLDGGNDDGCFGRSLQAESVELAQLLGKCDSKVEP